MTEENQLTAIRIGLATWAQLNGAKVHIAHDLSHLFRILGDNPGLPRIGILLQSETMRNETFSDVSTRVDRKFWIAVSRGYTLERFPGKSLTDGMAGGKPMFALIREAVNAVRALRFDVADEPAPFYHGYELLTFEGVTLDAYRIEITITAEDVIEENPATDPQYE